MSTTTPTPYVPYQAYKSKRHSRVISSPTPPQAPGAQNGAGAASDQLSQARHTSSVSIDSFPKSNGANTLKASAITTNMNADVAPAAGDQSLHDRPGLSRSTSGSRPLSGVVVPQQTPGTTINRKEATSGSEQTSPSSPKAPSIVSSTSGFRINVEHRPDSTSTTEPSSPTIAPSTTTPILSLNDSITSKSKTNGEAAAITFPSSLSDKSDGKMREAATEAGPSTSSSPLSGNPSFNPRRTSTFRYVSLRPPVSATTSSTPRTSSPLRPASTLGGHHRAVSTSGFSPLSSARQLGEQLSPLQAASRSPASIHSELGPDIPAIAATAQSSLLRASMSPVDNTSNNVHRQRTSITGTPPPPQKINPPQRTSSLLSTPAPAPPPKPVLSSPSPAPGPGSRPVSSSFSAASSRVQSPIPQSTPTSSTSTMMSTATASPMTHRTVYRPGFQPKGVYRPLTDDFLTLRKRARDKGRIEQTRLERRFEKLVDLHFSEKGSESKSELRVENGVGGGKGKARERQRPASMIYEAPALARRASSFFEELSDLKGKSASELWRGVLESRAAAANGGKGDIRAAEQRITPWQDDAEVSVCPLCSASFHPLTNRKHHCRLCGRIICSLPVKKPQRPVPCSLLFISDPKTGRIEEVSEGVDYGVKPRARTSSNVGAGTKSGNNEEEERLMKGVRICKECKPIMLRQEYRQEARRVPTMVRLYEALVALESEIEETLPHFQELMLSLSNNPDEAPTKEASAARKHLLQCFADYDAIAKRIRKIPCPGGPGSSQDRVQAAIQARANMFLQKNMFPLQSLPKPKTKKRVNGDGDATPSEEKDKDKEVVDPDSELARALQPLLEQEALLESFVEEATRNRKFEDAKTLKTNLREIRGEIDRIVVSADSGQTQTGVR